MPNINASVEYLPRYSVNEYGIVHLQVARVVTLDTGETMESLWRTIIYPDTTMDEVQMPGFDKPPQALIDAVKAARYPAAVARYEAQKATNG